MWAWPNAILPCRQVIGEQDYGMCFLDKKKVKVMTGHVDYSVISSFLGQETRGTFTRCL